MRRPSLNHAYRLIWNESLGAFVVASELTRRRGKGGKRCKCLVAAAALSSVFAFAAPTGGVVTSGTATISSSGATTNISQSTQKASINWQGFSIASNETVNFKQPNASAITLNRVIGNEKSVIDGALNANGKVFLINSNGVLISKGGSVNTGGFLASTLNLSDEDFNAGKYVFKADGSTTGSVINLGTITAADGGYVALLGSTVSNQGVITATKGTVAMASGNQITLNFNGNSLVSVTVDEGTLNALVENKEAIYADGGTVILTAKAANELVESQVSNCGVIQARTIDDLQGSITLYAHGGTAVVDGTLDASAPNGGKGGSIETSGQTVSVADSATVTTLAASGESGTWLIDPTNFSILNGNSGQTTSGIGATTLANALKSGNVSITTDSSGSQAGDINIGAAVSWTTANALTLTAAGDINANAAMTWSAGSLNLNAGKNVNINAALSGSGTGSFSASWGSGANSDGTPYGLYTLRSYTGAYFTGLITLAAAGTGTVTLNGTAYTVLRTNADLAKIAADPTGHYVLGVNLTTAGLTGALGSGTAFTGVLEGFGHSISLNYNTSTKLGVADSGLFNTIGAGGLVRDLTVAGTVTSTGTTTLTNLGALANDNQGTILNANATATIGSTVSAANAGGMVGLNEGTVMLSYSGGSLYATGVAGGLVGTNAASGILSLDMAARGIYNAATATGISYVGGLVGVNYGSVDRSWAKGCIQLTDSASIAGGFAGLNVGTIDQSYSARHDSQASAGPHLAGFVGTNTGRITNSYSTVCYEAAAGMTLSTWIAGFAYQNSGAIDSCYATSYVNDTATHAGFVYDNTGGMTSNDYWCGGMGSKASLYGDNSGAVQLSAANAAKFSSYNGWSSNIWAASSSGYPVLRNTPVYAYVTYGVYGDALSACGNLGIGFQGGDSLTIGNAFHLLDSSGYLDAGYNATSSEFGTSIYSTVRGTTFLTQKTLTLGAGSIADKTYDGTTTATQGTVSLVGLVGDQTLGMSGLTGTFSDANVGSGKTVTIDTSTYAFLDGTNGGKANNYKIASGTTTTASVTPKALTVGSADVSSKTYDGTTGATVNAVTLSGIVGSDSVAISSWAGDFTDKNAGNDKSVVISNAVLTGTSAGNYTVSSAAVATTADITPRAIELYSSKAAADGVTTVNASQLYVKNAALGDTVSLSGSVTIGSGSGLQAITSVSGLSTSNPNYTVVGAVGSVMVGAGNLIVDKVASGTATVSITGTATKVTQTTDKAVIDWLRFSVGTGESLTFVQPSSSSITLNRVTGNEATVIAGALSANGKVFILNSNGILFKAGSSVNVAGLVASTLDISDSDFLNGKYVFTCKGGSGSVVDEGSIVIVDGGFLTLASENGVTVSSAISAPGADTLLVSAKDLTLGLDATSSNLTDYTVSRLSGTTSVNGAIDLRSGAANQATLELAGSALKLGSGFSLKTDAVDTVSVSLPSLTVGSGGDFTGSWVNERLASCNLSLKAFTGNLTLNDAITWSSDSILSLGASKDIDINKSITATGTNAGLVMNYGGVYNLLTVASYSGAVLDANGLPVANEAPEGTEYASITLSGSNASLKMNGQSYTLIHSVEQMDALDKCINGLWYNPKTGAYDVSVSSVAASVSNRVSLASNNKYYNPTTQAYDIAITQVVGASTYYYNPETKTYDLTAAYTGKVTSYFYDTATGKYINPSYSTATLKYWNPSTKQYDLSALTNDYYYCFDKNSGLYDIASYNPSTGRYYNLKTNAYDLSYYYYYSNLYYSPLSGQYDNLTGLYTVSGYYALAGNLDATAWSKAAAGSANVLSGLSSGVFDGLGHTIDNLTLAYTQSSYANMGLIGTVGSSSDGKILSTLRNIGLTNTDYTWNGAKSGGGLAYIVNWAQVDNAYSTGKNSLINRASYSIITDSFTASSNASLVPALDFSTIERCHATDSNLTGGGTNDHIRFCYATGDVTNTPNASGYSEANGMGGLVNSMTGGSIEDSFATGNVTGGATLGGLVGYFSTSDTTTPSGLIRNCYATGNVTSNEGTSVDGIDGVAMGGLVGNAVSNYKTVPLTIVDSFATGNVTGNGYVHFCGGLIGYITIPDRTVSTLTNCYATGDVTNLGLGTASGFYVYGTVNGLVGLSSSYVVADNCYATGTLTTGNASIKAVGLGVKATDSYYIDGKAEAAKEQAIASSESGRTMGQALQSDGEASGASSGEAQTGKAQERRLMDDHIIYVDPDSYSADLESIHVDEVQFDLTDDARKKKTK